MPAKKKDDEQPEPPAPPPAGTLLYVKHRKPEVNRDTVDAA